MLTEEDVERIADRVIARLYEHDRTNEEIVIRLNMSRLQARFAQLNAPERMSEVEQMRAGLGLVKPQAEPGGCLVNSGWMGTNMSEPTSPSDLANQDVTSLIGCVSRITSWMAAGHTYVSAMTRLAALDRHACMAWLLCVRIYVLRGSPNGSYREAPRRVQRYLLERRG